MSNEWFEQKEKLTKYIRIGLTKDSASSLARLCRVSGFTPDAQVEKMLPKALDEALNDERFLAAERGKGIKPDQKHAGGRPAKSKVASVA